MDKRGWEKLVTEFQFLQVDPGAKKKRKRKKENETKRWIEKDGCKIKLKLELGSSKIRLKNTRQILR